MFVFRCLESILSLVAIFEIANLHKVAVQLQRLGLYSYITRWKLAISKMQSGLRRTGRNSEDKISRDMVQIKHDYEKPT